MSAPAYISASSEFPALTGNQLDSVIQFVNKEAGIKLDKNKQDLIRSRLFKRFKALNCQNADEYFSYALNHNSPESEILIDVLTTNKTAFFREQPHFDFLHSTALPALNKQTSPGEKIRIWSAACSTGEEPYSLAMSCLEFKNRNASAEPDILATDISSSVLRKAIQGRYTSQDMIDIPNALQDRYFISCTGNNAAEVIKQIRRLVSIRRFNLVHSPYGFKHKFQIIFCRNVMIYFDNFVRDKVIKKLTNALCIGGYLFVGHSESVDRTLHPNLRNVAPSVYQKLG